MARPVGHAPAPLVGWGNFLFKWRNTVFPVVMLVLFFAFRPFATEAGDPERWLDWAGLLVVVAGSALRILVVGMAYIKRGGVNKQVYADDLVTEGMFAHGRNPLYVGNLLVVAGTLLIHGSPWVLALGGIFFGISYVAIVAAEERFLAAKFGDRYQDYCARVPRWWIRPTGLSRTLRGFSFNWRRVVLKEYTTLASTTLMVLVLLAEQAVYAGGLADAAHELAALGVGTAVIVVAAVAVRALKKSGHLREHPV